MNNHELKPLLPSHARISTQLGLTLVELMVSITIGLFILSAAGVAFLASQRNYANQDDTSQVRDKATFALGVLTRTIALTGYTHFSNLDGTTEDASYNKLLQNNYQNLTATTSNMGGVDNAIASASTMDSFTIRTGSATTTFNGSDALFVRYYGSSDPTSGSTDNSIQDCLGYGVPSPVDTDVDRSYNVFYVTTSPSDNNEPTLVCASRNVTSGKFSPATPILSGVESFQVLYGIDMKNGVVDPDSASAVPATQVLQWVNATQLKANVNVTAANPYPFDRVRAVRISILVHGAKNSLPSADTSTYNLFEGGDYLSTAQPPSSDIGVYNVAIPSAYAYRYRKVFSTTIYLRNRSWTWMVAP